MSISNHGSISTKNNEALRNKASYFKYRGKHLFHKMRLGIPHKESQVNKNGYTLTRERKALMFKKGAYTVCIVLVCISLIAALTVFILS